MPPRRVHLDPRSHTPYWARVRDFHKKKRTPKPLRYHKMVTNDNARMFEEKWICELPRKYIRQGWRDRETHKPLFFCAGVNGHFCKFWDHPQLGFVRLDLVENRLYPAFVV